jgi:hypothetical protein
VTIGSTNILFINLVTFQTITSRLFSLRAFLVISVLTSLCLSSNVGPRFFPLPALFEDAPKCFRESLIETASRLPPSDESDSFRVPMMAQTQKRSGMKPAPQSIARTAQNSCLLVEGKRSTSEFDYAILLLSSAPVFQPPGRAPPALV